MLRNAQFFKQVETKSAFHAVRECSPAALEPALQSAEGFLIAAFAIPAALAVMLAPAASRFAALMHDTKLVAADQVDKVRNVSCAVSAAHAMHD